MENQLPITLWRAALTDDGTVVGFAYDNGHDGRPIRGRAGRSRLICAVIDNSGVILAQDAHERKHPPVLSNPPAPYEPLALGVTLDAAHDRFIVRVGASFGDSAVRWWPYQVSTGKPLGEIVPEQPNEGAHGQGFHKELAGDFDATAATTPFHPRAIPV